MEDIAIYGAGGFGKEVACLINRINEVKPTWNLIGFFDDGKEIGTPVSHYGNVIGGLEQLNKYREELAIAMAIGDCRIVRRIFNNIFNEKVCFPNLIYPNFYMSDPQTFKIGIGNIIQGSCAVSCDVSLGDFNVLNGSICLGHDVKVDSFNTFMPAVRISGEVEIHNDNFFGVGSIVLQQVKIGHNIRLGAGSVLMTKPKDGHLYIGNPAKKMEL